MDIVYEDNETPLNLRLQGKYRGMLYSWIFGIVTLLPWNLMLTIGDYYYKLFPNYYPERVLPLLYMPFAVGPLAILACYESKLNTRKRNLSGLLICLISTLLFLVLDLATSGRGGIEPFVGVCAISASLGLADALYQGGIVGDLSLMCPEFLEYYIAGIAASGVLTSILRLLTKAAFERLPCGLRKGVLLFFIISVFLEFICILIYAVIFPKLPIVIYYRSKAFAEGSKTVLADLAAGGTQKVIQDQHDHERLTTKQLILENIDYAMNIFLIFVISLSIFPGFLYENTGVHQLGSWYPLVLVTLFNVWDLLARCITLVEILKLKSRKMLAIGVLLRFLFIPAFYFIAKYADQGWMMFLTSFLGFSNGYLYSCSVAEAPKGYKGPEQNAIGNILVFCSLSGVFVGVALDWLWIIGKKIV